MVGRGTVDCQSPISGLECRTPNLAGRTSNPEFRMGRGSTRPNRRRWRAPCVRCLPGGLLAGGLGRIELPVQGQAVGARHIAGRDKGAPGLPGLELILNGLARNRRDADQMMASRTFDLPTRGLLVAFNVLRTMRTGEFELAHKSFTLDAAITWTTRTRCASRAASSPGAGFHLRWAARRSGSPVPETGSPWAVRQIRPSSLAPRRWLCYPTPR
jgi:hypothetical protein